MQLDRLEALLLTAQRRLDEALVGRVVDGRAVGQNSLARRPEQPVDRLVERFAGDVPQSVVEHPERALWPGETPPQGVGDLAAVERVLALDMLASAGPEPRQLPHVA